MPVPPPECLKQPLKVPERLLLGPGPSNCPPQVLKAQSFQVIGHLHLEFTQVDCMNIRLFFFYLYWAFN